MSHQTFVSRPGLDHPYWPQQSENSNGVIDDRNMAPQHVVWDG